MGRVECEGMMQKVGWHSAELAGYEGEGGGGREGGGRGWLPKMKAQESKIIYNHIIFFHICARNF